MAFSYDPNNVRFTVTAMPAGLPIVASGFGENSKVKVEPKSDRVVSQVGTDGEVTFNTKNDLRATFSVTLQQESLTNLQFQALLKAQMMGDPVYGDFCQVSVQDFNGATRHRAAQCRIVKQPAADYEGQSKDVTWEFEGALTDINLSGQPQAGDTVSALVTSQMPGVAAQIAAAIATGAV